MPSQPEAAKPKALEDLHAKRTPCSHCGGNPDRNPGCPYKCKKGFHEGNTSKESKGPKPGSGPPKRAGGQT